MRVSIHLRIENFSKSTKNLQKVTSTNLHWEILQPNDKFRMAFSSTWPKPPTRSTIGLESCLSKASWLILNAFQLKVQKEISLVTRVWLPEPRTLTRKQQKAPIKSTRSSGPELRAPKYTKMYLEFPTRRKLNLVREIDVCLINSLATTLFKYLNLLVWPIHRAAFARLVGSNWFRRHDHQRWSATDYGIVGRTTRIGNVNQ